ncbi:hypothetical protein F5B17DRAFT_382115 [Nemania serpens]|nr:hypothetical protein F5B17DRAFT_382115 [Nemania serpens]
MSRLRLGTYIHYLLEITLHGIAGKRVHAYFLHSRPIRQPINILRLHAHQESSEKGKGKSFPAHRLRTRTHRLAAISPGAACSARRTYSILRTPILWRYKILQGNKFPVYAYRYTRRHRICAEGPCASLLLTLLVFQLLLVSCLATLAVPRIC